MGKRILVVDDDPVGVTLMEGRLTKAGYEVQTAANGVEGLQRVGENEPELVILDIEMPEMNGYTFMTTLRADSHTKRLPVIVLTAHEENKPIFARKGIAHYLVKPVNFDDLFVKIESILGK